MKDKEKQFKERIECGIAYCEDTAIEEIKQDFKMQEEKNKQIDEMAKDIYEQKSCDTSFEENCKLLAYDLVSLGWIKPDQDSVVLSSEQYSNYLITQINNEWLKEQVEKLQADNERLYKNLGKFKQSVSKETAEKILNEQYQECKIAEQDVLKARGGNKNDDYYKGFSLGMTNTKMHIQELAKQYGVEIKE